MEKKVLKSNELKNLISDAYESYGKEDNFKDKFMDHEGFKDVKAYRKTEYVNFENTDYLICSCGNKQEIDRYSYRSDTCGACGGVTFKRITDIEIKEIQDGVFAIFVSNVSMSRRSAKDVYISHNRNYVLGYNENYIMCNYGKEKVSGHLPDIRGAIYNLKNSMALDNVYYPSDLEDHLDKISKIYEERVEAQKKRVKNKSKRQLILEEFERKSKEIRSRVPDDYEFVAIREPGVALLFTPDGCREFKYDKDSLDLTTANSYWIRHEKKTVTDLETGKTYQVGLQTGNHAYLETYIDQFNNLSGIAYALEVSLDTVDEVIEASYAITNGFFFTDKNEGNLVDNDGNTNNRAPSWYSYRFKGYDKVVNREKLFADMEKSNQNSYAIKYAFEESLTNEDGVEVLDIDEAIKLSRTFVNYPVVESARKMGFTKFADEISEDLYSYPELQDAKSMYDVIGFKNKEFTRKLVGLNPNFKVIKQLSELFTIDKKQSPVDDIFWFNTENLSYRYTDVKDAMKVVGSAKRLKEYLINALNYQCIVPSETITILNDYYRMADRLGYNMKNKGVLFPSSLKKEHDIAVFSYNAIKEQIDKEEFEESVKAYNHLAYKQDKKDGLMIVIPKEPSDIIGEGKSLHHCVASYVSTVKNRNTRIVFVRRSENPDESFYTVEVKNDDVITQVRGLQNCKPTVEVEKFIAEWAKKKKLIMKY